MTSLEEALASHTSANDLGPLHWHEGASLLLTPEVLTARSVFLTQQSLERSTAETLDTQWDRLTEAEGYHKRSLDTISWQKEQLLKLYKSSDVQRDAVKELGRQLTFSHKLERACLDHARSNPLVDWFKNSSRLRASSSHGEAEAEAEDGQPEVGEVSSAEPTATYADSLESLAEPRPGDDEWAAASDVNPTEDDTGEHVGGVWNSEAGAFPGPPPEGRTEEEYDDVQRIPVTDHGAASGVDDSGEVKTELEGEDDGGARKRRKPAVPPSTPPPQYLLRRIPPLAAPGPTAKGTVAHAMEQSNYPWRQRKREASESHGSGTP